ncbi:hypothetical protein BJ944DRAFT_91843 [Cunninghamella echinulata]|nr:hypothetical protein BJ944DRAFT_91843 [Cunninghamella echinulata]
MSLMEQPKLNIQNQMPQPIMANTSFNGMPGHPIEYIQHSNHGAPPSQVHHVGLPMQLPTHSQQPPPSIQPPISSSHDVTQPTNLTSLPLNTQQQIAIVQSNHPIPIQPQTNPNSFVQQQQSHTQQQQQHFMSMASSSIGTYTQQQPMQSSQQQQQLATFDGTGMKVEPTSSATSSVYHTPTAPNEQLISQLFDSANTNEFDFVGRPSS